MATDTTICGICSLRQITKTSTHWCPDCEEAICDECKEHHKVLKITRKHEPIRISKYQSLPAFITDIPLSCIYHNEKYQQFCGQHDVPICYKCITDHGQCNVIPLDEVTKNAKTSEQFRDLEIRLFDLLKNIDRIRSDRETNMASIEDQMSKGVAEIKKIRNDINKILDKLEKDILKSLKEKGNECNEKIQKIISALNEKETATLESQTIVENIKQNATDLQTFIGIRDVEGKVSEKEQYLQSLMETKSLDQLELVYGVNTTIHNILYSLKEFGSVEIKTHAHNICLTREKDKQAQLLLERKKYSINEVILRLQQKMSIDGLVHIYITGCCMLSEGAFLFTNNSPAGGVYVVNAERTANYDITTEGNERTFDIVLIEGQIGVVTLGITRKNLVYVVDFKNRRKIKDIELPGQSYGITRDGYSLFVCVEKHGIYKINTADFHTSLAIKCDDSLGKNSHIAVFSDRIYYTNPADDSVMCCDRNGSRTWTFFRDVSILKGLGGITVDDVGNVYVVGRLTTNVLIVSSDGKDHKELLSGKDGLIYPSAISFEKKNKSIILVDRETAFLYNISRN